MKLRKSAIIIVVLIVLLHLVSCSGTRSGIIGKWQEVDGPETVEFFKDGTIKGIAYNGTVVQGKYTFVENDRIKVEFGREEAVEFKFTISGNEMILFLQPNNRATSFRRVN